jgi:hypothetical protein
MAGRNQDAAVAFKQVPLAALTGHAGAFATSMRPWHFGRFWILQRLRPPPRSESHPYTKLCTKGSTL